MLRKAILERNKNDVIFWLNSCSQNQESGVVFFFARDDALTGKLPPAAMSKTNDRC